MNTKLILDTDIGSDVDDAWALALCLASGKIDLVGVTLVHADLETRAKITLKMLKLAGRLDVPVYKGLSKTLADPEQYIWGGHEGANTDFSDIEGVKANDGAVDFILDTVDKYPGEVVLCPVGPLTNIAEAIRRSPETMRKVKKLAIMGTTFLGEGPDAAEHEHNGWVDPLATKIVFESGIPATIVGCNVTLKVFLRREDMKLIEGTPFGDYLADMTHQYYDLCKRDWTYMHDPLAVAAIIDPSIVKTQKLRAEILENGRAVYYSAGDDENALDVCVDVDVERFENMLVSEISSFAG